MLENCGRDADEDADDAVIEGGDIGNAVERVGEETDDDRGEGAAHHGGEDGTDGVGENRELEIECQFRGYDIDEERSKNEAEGPQDLPRRRDGCPFHQKPLLHLKREFCSQKSRHIKFIMNLGERLEKIYLLFFFRPPLGSLRTVCDRLEPSRR